MLKYLALAICAFCLTFAASAADDSAEKPAEKTVTKQIGGMKVIALLDNKSDAKPNILVGMSKEAKDKAVADGKMKTSINAFVVQMNGKTILFDTGLPGKGGTAGILPALKEAGISPDAIDAILITHFHFDHVGGLMDGDKPVFSKAQLYVPRVETDKWTWGGLSFVGAYTIRFNIFEWNDEVLPGIKALKADGHTPGHTIFKLEAGDGKLLVIGDLIHVPGVQLANPDVAVTYDNDPVKAVASRKRLFDMAAKEGLPVAAMHIPFPGMGVLAKEGSGYTFTELDK